MAADPVAAHEPSFHRKMGKFTAENWCDELNNSLCDYTDTISDYSDDPDDDPYYCPSDYPDDVCSFLSTIDQSWNHYLNPEHWSGEKGNVDHEAADAADAAKSRVDGNDYIDAAIKTGRALHFIQDAGTLVHTGRETEQADDYSIHYEYENWVDNNWSSYFKDKADTNGSQTVTSKSDVQDGTHTMARVSHSWLEEQWSDIKYSGYYSSSTKEAQGYCIADCAFYSHGAIDWIWQNA